MKRVLLVLALLPACAEGPAHRPLDLDAGGGWIGNAVCYGPHRDGQRPGGTEPSRAQLAEDLAILDQHWKLLRIYGSSGFAETLLQVIRESRSDMKVVLGIWIGPGLDEANRRELDAGIRLANEYPDVVIAVAVGNETQVEWSGHRVPLDQIIAAVREVRAAVTVPVTVADDFNYWNKPASRALADEVDFLMVHAHPLWNGVQLEEALPWLERELEQVLSLHAGRAIVLGETGWATMVHDQGEQAELIKGRPGEAEQRAFHDGVREWAATRRQPTFVFEAFDENWKGGDHPDEVEKHWGLFRADRRPKAAMGGGTAPE